jgi:hypothetical protein
MVESRWRRPPAVRIRCLSERNPALAAALSPTFRKGAASRGSRFRQWLGTEM